MTEQGSQTDDTNNEEYFSLEDLGAIYANALQGVPEAEQAPHQRRIEIEPTAEQLTSTIVIQGETDGTPVTLSSIIEAILFVGRQDGLSVSQEELQRILKEFSESEIQSALHQLQGQLVEQQASVRVVQDDRGFRLELSPDVESALENLQSGPVRETVLSQPAIDCLALIAYQPNILREELEKQLGQNIKPILTQLEKRGLIIEDDSRYTTSDRFLEIVGLDSLDDLPQSSL